MALITATFHPFQGDTFYKSVPNPPPPAWKFLGTPALGSPKKEVVTYKLSTVIKNSAGKVVTAHYNQSGPLPAERSDEEVETEVAHDVVTVTYDPNEMSASELAAKLKAQILEGQGSVGASATPMKPGKVNLNVPEGQPTFGKPPVNDQDLFFLDTKPKVGDGETMDQENWDSEPDDPEDDECIVAGSDDEPDYGDDEPDYGDDEPEEEEPSPDEENALPPVIVPPPVEVEEDDDEEENEHQVGGPSVSGEAVPMTHTVMPGHGGVTQTTTKKAVDLGAVEILQEEAEFEVSWTVNVKAKSVVVAAERGHALLRDRMSPARIFDVRMPGSTEWVTVDLDEVRRSNQKQKTKKAS